MEKYIFELINKKDEFDLRTKISEIEETIEYINNGELRKPPVFVGINIQDIEKVDKHSFVLAVEVNPEATDAWRQQIGKILANRGTLRKYCKENDETLLFEVKKK